MKRIAVFASGTGSNVANLINHFHSHSAITLSLVVSNNSTAGALEKAELNNIPILILSKERVNDGEYIADELNRPLVR